MKMLVVLGVLAISDVLPPDLPAWLQLGALGILGVFFLYIDPKNRRMDREANRADAREEREARLREIQLLIEAFRTKP